MSTKLYYILKMEFYFAMKSDAVEKKVIARRWSL